MIHPQIQTLRKQIDCCDELLVKLIAQRFRYTTEIGLIKKETDEYVLDLDRFTGIVRRSREQADNEGLDPDVIEAILMTIHNKSTSIMRKQRES